MIKVVVAEDHDLLRKGIRKVVDASGDMQVVGEAGTIDGAVAMIDAHQPHIVTLDIGMPGVDGLEGLIELREKYPQLPILILTVHEEERYAIDALRAGAAGYVTKSMLAEEVVNAVRKVSAGGVYVGPRLAELLAVETREPKPIPPHTLLTSRERQILVLIASGMQVRQVAAELSISVSSVNTYRARIFRKMRLPSNAALIRYALEQGLIR